MHKKVLIIAGPTASGKSDVALNVALTLKTAEIVNVDIGSFYTPVSIGTAKPDYKNSPISHHFFDILSTPVSWTVTQFRNSLSALITQIQARGNTPILVGGSGFYIQSFFFKSPDIVSPNAQVMERLQAKTAQQLYEELLVIDPNRAQAIYPQDHYRLVRALSIWYTTYQLPSSFQMQFDPIGDVIYIRLERSREQLYEKINTRTVSMFDAGWLEEGTLLQETPWQDFLSQKILGYKEVFDCLQGRITIDKAQELIAQQTRHYAKRQILFFKKMEENILKELPTKSNLHISVQKLLAENQLVEEISDHVISALKRG